MAKSLLFVSTIALVAQGLFFSVNAAAEGKMKGSSGTDKEEAFISTSLTKENPPGTPFSKGGIPNSPPSQEGYSGEKKPPREGRPRLEQARKYAERGVVDLAIIELQKMIELYPDDLEVHAYLGWAYSQKGLISDAVREFQKVLEINPDLQKIPFDHPMVKDIPAAVKEFMVSFEDMISLINEFSGAHEVLGLCYVLQGRLGDALKEYKKVLELESGFVRRGLTADGKKAISVVDQAIREYEDIQRERPDCVEACIKLACAQAGKGMLDMAVENMKKAISIEPDLIEARLYLGCFYAKKWMLDEALKELENARQLRDRALESLVTKGERYLNDGVFDVAVSVAREAITIDSRSKKARWLLAMAYGKKGEMDAAINVSKEILGLYPDDVRAYVVLGWIYAQRDLFEDAMSLAGQAMRMEPDNADIRVLMAFIYASQNQVYEAIAMCNMISEKMSVTNTISTNYGWVRGKVLSIEQKLREVLDVLEMKPDYPEAYLCLGWLYSKSGEAEKAIDAFRKAIELTPDSYDAHLYLGNLHVQRGAIKNALDEYNKALEILHKKAQDNISLGLESMGKGDVDSAIGYFNEAVKVAPGCEEAYYSLANAYEKKGLHSAGMILRMRGGGLDKVVK